MFGFGSGVLRRVAPSLVGGEPGAQPIPSGVLSDTFEQDLDRSLDFLSASSPVLLVNYATREITCKIVYDGPGRSGKTTEPALHLRTGPERTGKGAWYRWPRSTDRTLFFDFLPLGILGTIPRD